MKTTKQACLAIAACLAAVHTSFDAAKAANPDSPELDDLEQKIAALHTELDDDVEEQAEILELEQDDLDEIRGVTLAARGGEPKPK
ncbi:MAG: hypothetical protein ABW128_06740 [Rhizorhabdus sp.]